MIIRRKHNSNFTVIPNRVVTDERITLEAVGLLTYLLTRPDHWQVNAVHLAKHFRIGRNRTYGLLKQLEHTGYIVREQTRTKGSRQFSCSNYLVYDTPQCHEVQITGADAELKSSDSIEPSAGNSDTVVSNDPSRVPIAVSREQGRIVSTEIVNSLREDSAKAGAKAPTVTAQIWNEGRELLKQASSPAHDSIIGKWLKRVHTPEGKEKLRAIMRAAVEAGTADPVSYVTAALAKEFPPQPDFKTFDAEKWGWNAKAAIKTSDWSSAWGPPPGKKGCMMPAHLITTELIAALSARKIAA